MKLSTLWINMYSRQKLFFVCLHILLQVSSIRNHKKFDYLSLEYDISILTLASVLTFSSKVSPVCLPAFSQRFQDYAGQVATVTGWGTTASGGSPSNTLQEVQVTVISNEDCTDAYDQIKR